MTSKPLLIGQIPSTKRAAFVVLREVFYQRGMTLKENGDVVGFTGIKLARVVPDSVSYDGKDLRYTIRIINAVDFVKAEVDLSKES